MERSIYNFENLQGIFQKFTKEPLMQVGIVSDFDQWQKMLLNTSSPSMDELNYIVDWKRFGEFTVNKNGNEEKYNFNKCNDEEIVRKLKVIFGENMMGYVKRNFHQSGLVECNRAFLNSYLMHRLTNNNLGYTHHYIPSHFADTVSNTFSITDKTIDFNTTSQLKNISIMSDCSATDGEGIEPITYIFSEPITLKGAVSISREKAIKDNDTESILSSSCEISTEKMLVRDDESGYDTDTDESSVTESNTEKDEVTYDETQNTYTLPQHLALALFDDEFPGVRISSGEGFINILRTFAKLKEENIDITNTMQRGEVKVGNTTIPGLNVCNNLYQSWLLKGEGGDFGSYIDQNIERANKTIVKVIKLQKDSISSENLSNVDKPIVSSETCGHIADNKRNSNEQALALSMMGVASIVSAATAITIAIGQSNVLGSSIIFSTAGYGAGSVGAIGGLGCLSLLLCAAMVSSIMQTDYRQQRSVEDPVKESKPSSKENNLQVEEVTVNCDISHSV